MKKSVLFVVPTLFTDPSLTDGCVSALHENVKNLGIEYKICVVVNTPSQIFDSYRFSVPVEKLCGNLQFNISRALNTACKINPHFEYFCFFDEGIRISNIDWVGYILRLFTEKPSVGLVGCRPHTSFKYYNNKIKDDPLFYEVLWSDGILFTKMSIINLFNGFDESYFADCELQDFGYRLHASGYTNYYWKGLADSHKLVKFEKKHSNKAEILRVCQSSRKLFYDRWTDFERGYGFQTFGELA